MDSKKYVPGLRASVAGFPRKCKAFTLVELLVVIAIIALLAAIIFPVFSQVRESTRRGATISQMQKMYAAIKQYELDNRAYPEYLFGPALKADGTAATKASEVGLTMEEAAALVKEQVKSTDPDFQRVQNAQAAFKNSLYPTYVSDLTAFGCPDNPVTDTKAKEFAEATRFYQGDPDKFSGEDVNKSYQHTYAYYKYDAYDVSPAITADKKLDLTKYQPRYSRVWTDLVDADGLDNLSAADRAMYQKQLLWKSPSADTYLMMTSYHVPNSKIIVMWLNGSAKVLDTGKLVTDKFKGTNGRDWDAFRMTPTD